MNKIFFLLIVSFIWSSCLSQKTVTISGKIEGLENSMIYLGNKPNGINMGFRYIIYDSILSKNGSFNFKNFPFKEINFYSVQIEGSQAWLPFIIDTGQIFITAKKDSIYIGNVSGSLENDLYHLYRKKLLIPFSRASKPDYDSLDKYRDLDLTKYDTYSKKIKQNQSAFLLSRENFIKEYPSGYVSLLILKEVENQLSDDSLRYYFNLLSSQLQAHSKAAEIKYRIGDLSKNIAVGGLVPDFQFNDINGNKNNLYNIQAPFKLIVFWASWCGPCLAELPELKDFHANNKTVAIISFSIDYDKSSWIKSSNENEISWYSFSDSKGPEGKFATYFSVQQIPLMVLLDGNNKIIKYDVKKNELKDYIERK